MKTKQENLDDLKDFKTKVEMLSIEKRNYLKAFIDGLIASDKT